MPAFTRRVPERTSSLVGSKAMYGTRRWIARRGAPALAQQHAAVGEKGRHLPVEQVQAELLAEWRLIVRMLAECFLRREQDVIEPNPIRREARLGRGAYLRQSGVRDAGSIRPQPLHADATGRSGQELLGD